MNQDLSSSIAQLRKSYELSQLEETDAPTEPLVLFTAWLNEAQKAQIPEPTAMTLVTVGEQGQPSSRIVLLKAFDANGLVWFTNYGSRKGQELAKHPLAALQFHWVELERVVRIEGSVTRVSRAESEDYFHTRPLESRWSAWASAQSQVVASRLQLEQALEQAKQTYGEHPPCPPHWGGYRLHPTHWEFWQGRPSRLHDRLSYKLDTSSGKPHWTRQRLAP